MNSSMTALINTSSGETETLECKKSKWVENHFEQTTSYNGNFTKFVISVVMLEIVISLTLLRF